MIRCRSFSLLACLLLIIVSGCQSPYKSDQGALFGGLLGLGTGAAVGSALHNPVAGAAIGTGVGALSGAAVGSALDEQDAKNRALIAQQLGYQVSGNPVSIADVVNMTRAGVDEELIANHVRTHGVAAPLQAQDLITLQQQGVSKRVISAMQEPPQRQTPPVVVQQGAPPPVIVEEYRYGPPFWGPPRYYYHHYRPRPAVHWGLSFGN
ncbi:MAG: glycine zipper domain-containing protein [Thermoguttaceae bacterium]